MFSFQLSKLAIIAALLVVGLTFLNTIINAILSIILYIIAFLIIVGLVAVIFIPTQRWINGAENAKKMSLKIEEKTNQLINRFDRNKTKKAISVVNSFSDKLSNRVNNE